MNEFDGRKINRQALEAIRVRGVRRVEAGESPEVVIKALVKTRPRIYEWIAKYRARRHLKKFKTISRGREMPKIKTLFQVLLMLIISPDKGFSENANNTSLPDKESYIAGHEVAKEVVLRGIPQEFIDKARTTLKIAYQHTSHGTHVTFGLAGLHDYKGGDDQLYGLAYFDAKFDQSKPKDTVNKLHFYDHALVDYAPEGIDAWDLSRDETAFIQTTRNYLDDPKNAEINVIMWSWCNIAGHKPEKNYLPGMDLLISEYGAGGSKIGDNAGQRKNSVAFIFMTGHANENSNIGKRNPQKQADIIVNHCLKNKQFCLDYYSIDSHDMAGNYWDDAGDNGNSETYGGNFYQDWQNAHQLGKDWFENKKQPGGEVVFGAHNDQHITANRKAYAMWWILARIAGWNGQLDE